MADLESSVPVRDEDPLAAVDGYDESLQRIRLLREERFALLEKQRAIEKEHLRRIATAFRSDLIDMDDLADAYKEYEATVRYDAGYTSRWNVEVCVSAAQLAYRAKGLTRPNGPAGSWSGSYPLGRAPYPPDHQCLVYVLFDDLNQPCYVGSTQHFRLRLRQHRADGKQFAYWTAYPCDDRTAAYALEDRLLKEHKPYLNKRAAA